MTDNDLATGLAIEHSEYMAVQGRPSHDYFGANKVQENIGYAFTSARSLVSAWSRSDGHKAVLEGKYYYTTSF